MKLFGIKIRTIKTLKIQIFQFIRDENIKSSIKYLKSLINFFIFANIKATFCIIFNLLLNHKFFILRGVLSVG